MPHTLITGASSGIGRGIAQRLAGERSLVLHGRDASRLEELRASLPRPEEHRVWIQDLAETEALFANWNAWAQEGGLAVSGFVHAAGIALKGPVRLANPRDVIHESRVNVFSAIELVRALLHKKTNARHLAEVVLVSSIAARQGVPGMASYAASKAALLGWMRAVAVELAPRVRINAVLPGGIHTPGTRIFYDTPAEEARIAAQYPLGAGRVEDVAHLTRFLLSEEARWITGQEFVVDGGFSIL